MRKMKNEKEQQQQQNYIEYLWS